jgi:hypothetical protein
VSNQKAFPNRFPLAAFLPRCAALVLAVSFVLPAAATLAQPILGSAANDTGAQTLSKTLKDVAQKPPDAWNVVVLKLALAAVLGLILALAYSVSFTGKKKKYTPFLMQTQLLLCVGGALVWIIVGNNIARAFGIGGVLAFIRFRTPLRNPKDTVVVFLSTLAGMACGLGLYHVALIATAFVSLVLLGIYAFSPGGKKEDSKPE